MMVSTQWSCGLKMIIYKIKIPDADTEKMFNKYNLKKRQREPTTKAELPHCFSCQLFFSTDVHEVNNLNSVQLCFAIKFIVHSRPCFCVSENILSLEWNTGVHEVSLDSSLNQEKSENVACFPLGIQPHCSYFNYENENFLQRLSISLLQNTRDTLLFRLFLQMYISGTSPPIDTASRDAGRFMVE